MGNAAAMGSFVQEDILPGSPMIKREQSNLETGEWSDWICIVSEHGIQC
jgi:hypothetical protein